MCNGIRQRIAKLFSGRVNVTYPTQYMSGGLEVLLSQGRRLSFGVCPLTLYVPRKKLKQNGKMRSGHKGEVYTAAICLNKW